MIDTRRGLLFGLGAMLSAPAVVRAASLMPVRTPPLLHRREWVVGVVSFRDGGGKIYARFGSIENALDAIDKMKWREPAIVTLLPGPFDRYGVLPPAS